MLLLFHLLNGFFIIFLLLAAHWALLKKKKKKRSFWMRYLWLYKGYLFFYPGTFHLILLSYHCPVWWKQKRQGPTMRCWNSQERMMLVACLGKTPLLFFDFLSSPSKREARSRFTLETAEGGIIVATETKELSVAVSLTGLQMAFVTMATQFV